MRDNKTMIRFYLVLFVVVAVLTYIVDLNGQIHFLVLNSPYISNAFCFAILSGASTGLIVATASELRQYLLHKRQARQYLYTIAGDLYALISVQKSSIKYYINNKDIFIPENIGGDYAQQPIQARISQFQAIDYSAFSKKDIIGSALREFRPKIELIERSVRNLARLQIAHNHVQVSFLKKSVITSKVTAASPEMLKALQKGHDDLRDCLVAIDAFCAAFEKLDDTRFSWKLGKKAVDDIARKNEENVYFEPEQE